MTRPPTETEEELSVELGAANVPWPEGTRRGRDLTVRQARVLALISDSITNRGYPPTMREIGEHMGIRSAATAPDAAVGRRSLIVRVPWDAARKGAAS